MRLRFVMTGVLLSVGLLACSHPLHLTFTNLEFKTGKNHWLLTVKVFSDDYTTEKVQEKWLENGLKIWFDGLPVEFDTWKFDKIRVKEDASWLTYTFTAPMPGYEIKIRNTLLFDLYPDQKNLFMFTMGQFQSAHEFKNKDQETVIRLNK